MDQLGKILVLAGLLIVLCGGVLYLLGKLGIGHLPGDLSFEGKNWRIYFPIGTCILLSVLFTLLFYLINHYRKRFKLNIGGFGAAQNLLRGRSVTSYSVKTTGKWGWIRWSIR